MSNRADFCKCLSEEDGEDIRRKFGVYYVSEDCNAHDISINNNINLIILLINNININYYYIISKMCSETKSPIIR